VRGAALAGAKKAYRMHRDIERKLERMGPLNEEPPKLG